MPVKLLCTFLNPDKTSKDYSEEPSIKLYCVPKVQLDKNVKDIGQFDGITLNSVLMRPKSRGEIKLKSSDPNDMPLLNPNYLSHDDDKRLQISAFKYSTYVGMRKIPCESTPSKFAQTSTSDPILESFLPTP